MGITVLVYDMNIEFTNFDYPIVLTDAHEK